MSEGKIIGTVGFGIDGGWLTSFIRNRFLYEGMDFDWVLQTIGELLGPNSLSKQRIEQISQDIILGRSYFSGNSRDGSIIYCDCSDEPLKSDFFRRYARVWNDFKKVEQAKKEAVDAWNELALVLKGEMHREDCECQCNIDLLRPTPTEEYINRMIAPGEAVAPYGFIAPDGTFYLVAWCEHEEFAWKQIREHHREEEALDEFTGKDFLICRKGWLLLHNPRQGKPILTSGDKPMTKAQREALFDYYTKYGMSKEASELYGKE